MIRLRFEKKLLASLLAEHHKRKPKKYRLSAPSAPLLSKQVATAYYTTTEVAKKFAHALQEVAATAYLIGKVRPTNGLCYRGILGIERTLLLMNES
jgi:hypothetical protein